jgi:DNA-binding transcriptional regulator YdaS (Cro superfamily)
MNLNEYFQTLPHGSKVEFAKQLGITKTWMSLITSGRRVPSGPLCYLIERISHGKVTREELRPDIFGSVK